MGTHLGQVYTDWQEGSLEVTDKSTDLAIGGSGFFAVSFTDKAGNTSMKLTRDGAFTVNVNGYLVTSDGDFVLNATGALNGDPSEENYVRIDPNADFSIDSQGYIYQNNQLVGTIGVVDVDNYDYIEKYGENLYNVLDGGNLTAADGTVIQGTLETSNVNVINEMVNMITIQRAYDAGQKVITSIDETLDKAVNQVGKV
jgi:flagellar basal-body rod protein FlgG